MRIELLSLTQTVLIIPGNTGVTYTNQVGGTECAYPELEGSIVPVEYDILLEDPLNSLTLKICKLFPDGNPGDITCDIADKIQSLLDGSPYTKDIKVDRCMLEQSKEAWLNVKVKGSLDDTIDSSDEKTAVLTWPNSD
ncbi:MAG: hypothetical protein KUG78_08505 [Kangiellaceae bacterium]|nr:hypothetical protein [Kangiellaceae bacterium]